MEDTPTTKIYELGYQLLSTLSEADVHKFHADVIDLITSHTGEVISEMNPELIRLAYPMFKIIDNKRIAFETAHFGVIKFEGTIALMEALSEMVKANKGVLRHLLINTVKEDTLVKKRPIRGIQKASKEEGSESETSEVVETPVVETIDHSKEEEMESRINKLVEEKLIVEGDE